MAVDEDEKDVPQEEELVEETEHAFQISFSQTMDDRYKQFLKCPPKSKMANANLLVKLKMFTLYYYAALMNRLVLSTGDKSELRLGHFAKYVNSRNNSIFIVEPRCN